MKKKDDKVVTRSPNGEDKHEVNIINVHIPDLWYVAVELQAKGMGEMADMVLETWHIAHDLKHHIISLD